MKTLTILMVALLALGMMVPLMAAAEDNVTDVVDVELDIREAGITPDSPLYGLDKAMERLRLVVTFGETNKVKLKLKFAEERLSETEQMIEEGNDVAAEEAQLEHDETLDEVQVLVESIESDDSEEAAGEALDEVSDLQLKLLSHSEKINLVHNRILERLSTEGNVSDAQLAHLEEVFAKIQDKSLEIELKIDQKRNRLRIRYKVLSEKSEDELSEREFEFISRRDATKDRVRDKILVRSGGSKVKIELKRNVRLSEDTLSSLRSLASDIGELDSRVELKLEIKRISDGSIEVDDRVRGNLTSEQLGLWASVVRNIATDVANSDKENAGVNLEIKYRSQDSDDDDDDEVDKDEEDEIDEDDEDEIDEDDEDDLDDDSEDDEDDKEDETDKEDNLDDDSEDDSSRDNSTA